jgi:hypothetical protein
MLDRLPDEMKVLMKHVNHECTVLAHHAGSMGWSVDFQIKNTNLSLIYERGSLVVTKEPGGAEKSLFPKDKDMFSVTMEDLSNEVNKEFA